MTAETFYENFKDALVYLSCRWGDMEQVSVYLKGNQIVYEYQGRTASITVPENKDAK